METNLLLLLAYTETKSLKRQKKKAMDMVDVFQQPQFIIPV
jgi:hypothetical protein